MSSTQRLGVDALWIKETLGAVEGLLLKAPETLPEGTIDAILSDSRRAGPGTLFVALSGERFDGHDFVADVARRSAPAALVARPVDADIAQFVVADTVEAYGTIAARYRRELGARIVAVAGSNGKTTTTQMVAAILRAAHGDRTASTAGNFNNHVGVPQTLLGFPHGTEYAVVEAGMNHPGELARLADWIRPDTVLLTNAQREHQEFLAGVRETAWENGLAVAALPDGGFAVYPSDDASCDVWASIARARGVRALTFATDPAVRADAHMTLDERGDAVLVFSDRTPGGAARLSFPFRMAGEHNRHNAAGAALAARTLGLPDEAIVEALANFQALRGRGAAIRTEDGSDITIYDEAYNANPDSMKAAMRILVEDPSPAKVFLMGDMGEVGREASACHAEVGAYARELGLTLWTCGELSKYAAEACGPRARRFATVEELLEHLPELPASKAAFTVKASHSMGFDRVVARLLELHARRDDAPRNPTNEN